MAGKRGKRQIYGDRLLVRHECCNECLFSTNRVVSGRRAADVIKTAREQESGFICHKFSIMEADEKLSHADANVVCRGYYDQVGDRVLLIRLARMLGFVRFVDGEGKEIDGGLSTADTSAAGRHDPQGE
jgi:hypothetical protein